MRNELRRSHLFFLISKHCLIPIRVIERFRDEIRQTFVDFDAERAFTIVDDLFQAFHARLQILPAGGVVKNFTLK